MKFLFLFFLLSVISVAFAHDRGCIYINEKCSKECEVGTHAYVSTCMPPTWSQKTCKEPVARDLGGICGLSRCDCDEGTVLDEKIGKCVKPADCSK